DWYAANRRDLPWRRTADPYAILVSEVMLQQTQVARVVPRYEAWLDRWPTAASLAHATVAEGLSGWVGLGHQRRALRLREARARAAARRLPVLARVWGGRCPRGRAPARCALGGQRSLGARPRRRPARGWGEAAADRGRAARACAARPRSRRSRAARWERAAAR